MMNMNLFAHKKALNEASARANEDKLVERLWAGDHSLWSDNEEEISNRLGWLDIAERMKAEIPDLNHFANEINEAGITKVLLLGMGGSSLAPEVFSRIFGNANGYPSLSILDSTDPRAVREKMEAHDPATTLYIVSTKSGGTVETLSFFKTFYNQCLSEIGEAEAGQHFIAITDPGSKLADLAGRYKFRKTFLNDPNIGGRYSALSHFGLVPAALLGIDLEKLLDSAMQMAEKCRIADASVNPGDNLGLAIGTLADQGIDKLTFHAPKEIAPFGDWAEQLIAESTGKAGKGIVPIVGGGYENGFSDGADRVFMLLDLGSETHSSKISGQLSEKQLPYFHLKWTSNYDIGGQMFLWEFATAIAGAALNIHPFNQPNVESAKILARKMVEDFISGVSLPKTKSAALSVQKINELVKAAKTGAYISIQAYTHASIDVQKALFSLKDAIERKYSLATTIGIGPRFLHSTGQLHKGDGGNGLFIQILGDASIVDLAVPLEAGSDASEISFEVLKRTQAFGDASALSEAGRIVLTFEIEGKESLAIDMLTDKIKR